MELGSLEKVSPLVSFKKSLKHKGLTNCGVARKFNFSVRLQSTHTNPEILNDLSSSPPNTNLDSILICLFLSDAGLYRSSPTYNTRLEMSLGAAYEEFALFIGEILSPYMSNPVKSI